MVISIINCIFTVQTLTINNMTNAEIILSEAIKNRDLGKLNDFESNFVSQFEGWSKKQLRNLSSKQYKLLRSISEK